MVLMLAVVLVVSLLIFKGYSFGLGGDANEAAAPAPLDPVSRAKDADAVVRNTVEARRQALEQQLQQ